MSVVAAALLQALALAAPGAARAEAAAPAQAAREEELLLFAVELDMAALTEALTAFGEPEDPYLPIGELSRLLDLDLHVDVRHAEVSGTLGRERRPVLYELAAGTGRNGGRTLVLTPGDFRVSPNDIFVRAAVLQQLLPIRVAVDAEALSIRLGATEILPVQERQARLARGASVGAASATPEDVLRIASPYGAASAPGFDFVLEAGYDTREGSTRRYEIRTAGDLLWGSIQAYFGSDRHGSPRMARFLYERRSAAGLMPLGLRRFSAGDVFTPALAVGPRSVAGRGISVSSAPLEHASVFDTIDLRGELPIGHDVELYVNDVLRGSQSAPIDGRYQFLAVPLSFGINRIRIVMHGPRGERSEQERVINVGGGQLRAGETWFEAGLVEQERALVEPGRRIEGGLLRAGVGERRLVASIAHGVSSSVTLVGGFAAYSPTVDAPRHLATAGVRSAVGPFAVQADAAVDSAGGAVASLGAAGRVAGVSAVVRHAEYGGGFIDETIMLADPRRPMSRRTSLTADASLPIADRPLPVSFRLLRTAYADGGSSWLAGGRISTGLGGTLLSAGFDYQRESSETGAVHEQLLGSLTASAFAGGAWQLRGLLDYEFLPRMQLRTFAFSADRSVSDDFSLRFGVSRSFAGTGETSLDVGPVLRLPFGDLAFTGTFIPEQGDWRVGLRFSLGSLFDPGRGRYRLTRPGPAAGGAVSFEAFVDRDGDGRFAEGDDPVPGVTISGGEQRGVTAADGRAIATGFGTATRARLEVDTAAVEDVTLAAPPALVAFAPRPGQVVRVSYPLAPVGEVYLRIVVSQPDRTVGISALRVRLVGSGGRLFEATTQYDGSVVFGELPLGRYRLELDPEQAARLRASLAAPLSFEVGADAAPTLEAEVRFGRAVAAADGEQPDA